MWYTSATALVVIKTFQTRIEAEVQKGFLEASNITAAISADNKGCATPFPFQSASTGVKHMVEE